MCHAEQLMAFVAVRFVIHRAPVAVVKAENVLD